MLYVKHAKTHNAPHSHQVIVTHHVPASTYYNDNNNNNRYSRKQQFAKGLFAQKEEAQFTKPSKVTSVRLFQSCGVLTAKVLSLLVLHLDMETAS